MAKDIPKSLFSRGTKLMGLAGRLALEEVNSRVRSWEDEKSKLEAKVRMARDLVETLSHLKGASMKVGQLLSLDLGEFLPPEMLKVLEQLQNKVSYLPYSKVAPILRQELGAKFTQLQKIEETPLAAASIGQVHRAQVSGEAVVIKVQYPGVAESIPSDIKLLRLLVKQLSFLHRSEADMAPLFEEIELVLRQEADYDQEARMQARYREKLHGDEYVVPRVYPELSTTRVIVQEFVVGVSFSDWLAGHPPLGRREALAAKLMRLYLQEIFVHRLVQTDPNPGNFLVAPDERLVLLDFGAVKEYSAEFIAGYREVIRACVAGDQSKLWQKSLELGFFDPRESSEVRETYVAMMELLGIPFRSGETFDFGDKEFNRRSRELVWELSARCRYSPPPRDLLFLHRKLGGVFSLIRKLEVKVRLADYWHYVESPS